MSFAKRELEKYGWKEGKGLGKDEDGICQSITTALKFDSCGVGYNYSEDYTTNWWEQLYNSSANRISVNIPANDGIVISVTESEDKEVTPKNLIQNINYKTYSTFVKTSTLTGSTIANFENANVNSSTPKKGRQPTDEELFDTCEGRTGHKTARHGLKLSGKLSRIEKQEKLLLKQLKKISLSDNDTKTDSNKSIEKKLKKLDSVKKSKKKSNEKDCSKPKSTYNPFAVTGTPKRNKKEKKRVSFNETVTEYQTHDVNNLLTDSSSQSEASSRPSTPLIIKVQDKTKDAFKVDQDEGIDCSDSILIRVKPINDVPKKGHKDKLNKHFKKIRNVDGIKQKIKSGDNQEILVDEIEKNKKYLKRKGKQDFDGDLKKMNKKYRTCDLEFKHTQSKQQKPLLIVNQQITAINPQITVVSEHIPVYRQQLPITNRQQLSVVNRHSSIINRPHLNLNCQHCVVNRQHSPMNCHYCIATRQHCLVSRQHCLANRQHSVANRQQYVANRQQCTVDRPRPAINRKVLTVAKQAIPAVKQTQVSQSSEAQPSITKNEEPLNNRINKIADILTDYCKISDTESA